MSVENSFKTETIEEALDLLEKYKQDAVIIAGGTDLVIELRNNVIDPRVIIDVSHIKSMRYIREEGEKIAIGAATTFTDIVNSKVLGDNLEGLKKSARLVGSPLIRNKGTVGGNICHGSPAADIVPPLLALDASVIVRGPRGEREEKLESILLGKGQVDVRDDELLTDIIFDKPVNGRVSFSKLGLRNALAISRICLSTYLELDEQGNIKDIRIASGALGVNGLRERSVEDALRGRKLDKQTLELGISREVDAVTERLEGRSSLLYKGEAVKPLFEEAMTLASGITFS